MGFYSLDERAIKKEIAYKNKISLQHIYCFRLLHFCA